MKKKWLTIILIAIIGCIAVSCDNGTIIIDKSQLQNSISSANSAKEDIITSADGTDVLTTVYWVTQSQMDTFTTAIATAQSVYDNANANQAAVDNAKNALVTATTVFNGQKQAGTKTETIIIDKSQLQNSISSANSAKEGIVTSASGTDVLPTVYWVTQSQMDAFTTAIATAQSVYDNANADQATVDNAKNALVTATTVFNGQKQAGSKTDNPVVPTFTSIADFSAWLDEQPDNTETTPYVVALNVSNLGGRATTEGTAGFVLRVNETKYVNLDLSESALTEIVNGAFEYCYTLTGITIPAVNSIGGAAFFECTSLTSITIPDGVTSIGSQAFPYCTSLTAITVNTGNTTYSSQDGVLYNKNKTTLIQYPAGKTDNIFSVPNSVTLIGNNAFSGCTSLTSVTIPAGVNSIGETAFSDCASITSATIPESVTSIGYAAFSGCASLTSVTFATGSNIADASFGNNAFPKGGEHAFGNNSLKTAYSTGKAGTYTREENGDTWTKQE